MRLSPGTAVGSLALAAALAGGAYAAIPSADGAIKGCYATTNGLLLGIPHSKGDLRAVDSGEACRSYERAVSWSQRGPRGATGPQGAKGDTGATGPAGPAGPGPVAFGRVNADGTIDAASSVGFDTATVSRASGSSTTSSTGARWSTSTYCVNGLGTPKVVLATAEPPAALQPDAVTAAVLRSRPADGNGGFLCRSSDFSFAVVVTQDHGTNAFQAAFDVVVY